MHHIVLMQEGHTGQDLLGQPDHVFLREGLVVIGDALVEDFATGGAGRKEQEGKLIKQNIAKMRRNDLVVDSHPVEFSLANFQFWLLILAWHNKLLFKLNQHTLPLKVNTS